MIVWRAAFLLLPALLAAPTPAAAPEPSVQVVVREQIIIRMRAPPRGVEPASVNWKENKGPKCLEARNIVGASMLGKNSVDLILRDRSRVRARLERACPALDFYYGFYITPNPDGKVCADRDRVRSRMGGRCEIEQFRTLTMEPRRGGSLDKRPRAEQARH